MGVKASMLKGIRLKYLVLLTVLALAACSRGGSDEQSSEIPPPAQIEDPVQIDNSKDRTISIDDPQSPIFGTKVLISGGTIPLGNVDVSIGYEDVAPGELNVESIAEGATFLSKTIVLSKNMEGTFDKPLIVTVPYNASLLESDDVPSVFYWNPETASYQAVAVISFDPVAGFVKFQTAHFSKYVVIGSKGFSRRLKDSLRPGSSNGIVPVTTGFIPSQDSFFRSNISSYSSPGGNCLGMASYADWFFESAKIPLNGGVGLKSSYLEGDLAISSDDIVAEELIVRAHAAASQVWARRLKERFSELTSFQVGVSLMLQMIVSRAPQIFLMYGNPTWSEIFLTDKKSWGHALVAYSYDFNTKQFRLYDPNLPGDNSMAIGFDEKGFGSLSKVGLYDPEPNVFAYDSVGSIYSPGDMRALYEGARGGWSDGQFGEIQLSSPALSPNDLEATVSASNDIVISGTLIPKNGDVNATPDRVDIYVGGSKVGTTMLANNQFTYTISSLPNPARTEVALVAYRLNSLGNNVASIYGTFKKFQLRVAGSSIENFGFELNNFTYWFSERHTWNNQSQVVPSDKSEVVAAGFDAIATDVRRVLYGQSAVRVNNSDDDYHISTISRDIIVPIDAQQFRLAFNWAAVLEDPDHPPEDQPYVLVRVVNTTKNIVLYEKRYYSNDPSYAGWIPYRNGRWKAIDWQPVLIDNLEIYRGDTIRLHIEGADCGQGAHGGYVYFDAEE